ncbi:hypothetical protein ACJIZ3_024684 [Penstemon smallii]|uniref:Myb/SANT-like DNA-binding domain-containing protein n=1 Tax=Penstemon smallii TaxID=265156 RepID=A0ABD3TVU4_9LAMI
MEGNLASGSMMHGNSSYGGFDLQGPVRVHHNQQHPPTLHHQHKSHPRQGTSNIHPTAHENFPLTIGSTQEFDRGKSASDEDEPSFTEDNPNRGKKASPWQRVKWTDTMVRLLITAVSYISEETSSDYGGGGARRKYANLQKKGKWKSVSKVMAERGHFVSPQQCEDKFNDLNKRYKRLNEILGRGTSCEVVENPSLLDVMDHVSEKSKEEVRKILSSKHLHYEEMCSYHNGNRLHLPPDLELQRSLRLALRSRDEHDENNEGKRQLHDDNDEGEHEHEQEIEYDDHDEYESTQLSFGAKRAKQCQSHIEFSFGNTLDCNKASNFQGGNAEVDKIQVPVEGTTNMSQKEWISRRSLELEEQRLHIQGQMLELEKERFKWQRFCRKKDQELEMMKMEIEKMKLDNERMALELRQKEMCIENN